MNVHYHKVVGFRGKNVKKLGQLGHKRDWLVLQVLKILRGSNFCFSEI